MAEHHHRWYRLDNAAKIYPASLSDKKTSTFRVSAQLKERVDPELLQEALCSLKERFPTMFVTLRKGLFWYFFEHNIHPPVVWEETNPPCSRINPHENNGYLFKVYYFDKRVSLECFHALTDGYGAMEFLKTLLLSYFRLKGYDVTCGDAVKAPWSHPSKNEISDCFLKYYDQSNIIGRKEERAQHIDGIPFEGTGINVIHGILSAKALNQYAKSQGATMTGYLAALLIYAIYEENMKYGNCAHPIKISIPVNLRRIFPSQSLRNFSSYVNVAVKPDHSTTLEDIIHDVSSQLKKGIKKENLYPRINANVKSEKAFIRGVPLVIKNMVLRRVMDIYGDNLMTAALSNLGIVTVSESMKDYIDYFCFALTSYPQCPVNMAVCSYDDKLNITFSRVIAEPNIIRYFFRHLAQHAGLDVRLYSNDWGIKK